MPEFLTPVDIANRALQRVGADLMDSTLGFAENSKRAQEVSFCYGKLRQAELQRNTWTFATTRAAIRALDLDTALLNPTLFDATVTYFLGSIVEDQAGTLWESTQRDNIGNDPQNTPAWKPYSGPMTAEPFDSSKSYYNGELTYTISGAGTYNLFRSLTNANAIHPAMPNLWVLDTKYKQDDIVVIWPAWSSGTTYSQGQTVQFTDGNVYSSLTNGNLNNTPQGSNWALMPVLKLLSQQFPTTTNQAPPQLVTTPIDEWQIDTTYSLGQFVIYNAAIYVSIVNSNTQNNPAASASFWSPATGGTSYQSPIDFNQNNNPALAPPQWNPATVYSIGNRVVGASNGLIYISAINSNIGLDPTRDTGSSWTNTHVLTPWIILPLVSGNSQWLPIGGNAFPNGAGLTSFQLTYPTGSGPLSQTGTRNVYRLPANWLRKAPQNPKVGINSWLGSPGEQQASDWVYDGKFIVTWNSSPILYRFITDVQDVRNFHPLFCEMLGCSIALEICEALTQSTAKKQIAAQEYKLRRLEAISVDAIEQGPITTPLDDLIASRL